MCAVSKPRRGVKLLLTGLAGILAYWALQAVAVSQTGNPQAPGAVDPVREILPIFEQACYACHGPKQQMGGLRLDSKAAALAGGQSGKVILPGDSANSLIVKRLTGAGGLAQMPMGGAPLPPEKIDRIKKWIDSGAAWLESAPDSAVTSAEVQARKHWAFIAPVRPTVPAPKRAGWVRNPIDAFILARLERQNLQPSPEAGGATLLRRLSLDLIGLPPTSAELDAFLADQSANAYEKQVDRLLASPHYGERWGRVWLDAARYADSNGY
jgi:mono/diheme cytochrome c family protein